MFIVKVLEFGVHGPFRVAVETARAGPELLLDGFWGEGTLATLRAHCGCYVFALRRVKGETVPQYVGLTRRRFDDEVFNRSNLVKYRNAMAKTKRGQPVLFLIVSPQGKGKVSRKYIGELENFLIQAGSARNPEFRNVKGVPRPKWLIRGVTGRRAGKPPTAARKLREAMGITG
jgi:hypothetical protein